MIDSAKVCVYTPNGLREFKQKLFDRITAGVLRAGGRAIRADVSALAQLPADIMPLVGCMPECTPLIEEWRQTGRRFAYWDRGYCRRVFAASLPPAADLASSYYRVHINRFQLGEIGLAKPDRWKALGYDKEVRPWSKGGRHIVIAAPSRTYARFHKIESWIADTIDALARVTDRQLVIRDKEHVRNRPLWRDLDGAHALVTHGSIAAVESVVMGCPVFVSPDSAAAVVGRTDLSLIEKPVYPDRDPWFWSLADNQWNEAELANGIMWSQLS